MKTTIALAAGALIVAGAGAAAAEDWNPVSRSSRHVYMADVDSIAQTTTETSIQVARVPAAAPDRSYRVQTFAFDCAANQFRLVRTSEHGDDGAETDSYDEDGAMEPVASGSYVEIIKQVACDGERADPPTWPTLAAFLDAR